MSTEWSNRTHLDVLTLDIFSGLLCARVTHINHMIRMHGRENDDEYLYFDFDEIGIVAAMTLLKVDVDWVMCFMHRARQMGIPISGNTPADVLAKGYSFELRHISSCDEATNAKPCCVRPYAYIVKEQSAG